MFKSLRWNIAIWFLCLSSLVYISSALLGLWMFREGMLAAVDDELRVVAGSVGRAVDLKERVPYFRDWMRTVHTEPARSIITIELFDKSGKLLENYGPAGSGRLALDRKQIKYGAVTARLRTSPLISDGETIGYMQLELSTANVDSALRQFGVTMAVIAPFVILGLTATSVLVSRKVTRPFEEQLRVLKRFVSDASHELNTPLSIIQARAESLHRKLVKQDVGTEDVDSIIRSTQRMTTIVSDLMLLSEVEGALSAVPKVDVDMQRLVQNALDEFAQRFEQANIKLSRPRVCNAVVEGYPDALHRLLSNVLENSLRYTDPGGSVEVSLSIDERTVLLSVEDTGIGIPGESMALIFDRFYRVDKSRARASGGSGLGLSIVRAIADVHGGTIFIKSTLGVGTKISLSFPLKST